VIHIKSRRCYYVLGVLVQSRVLLYVQEVYTLGMVLVAFYHERVRIGGQESNSEHLFQFNSHCRPKNKRV
jgi:hypothetical protein